MTLRISGVRLFLPGAKLPLFAIPSLEIASGERVLIHGPSGAGKSTLLHLLAGLFPAPEGDVFVGDTRLGSLSDAARAALRRGTMGIVFQQLNLIAYLTAVENVVLGGSAAKAEPDRARAALDRLGCRALADERTDRLSLGEQQRIAVARCLYAGPRVVLADEPTSSLDAVNAEAVADALFALPGNPTIVTVSHDDRLKERFPRRLAFADWTAEGATP